MTAQTAPDLAAAPPLRADAARGFIAARLAQLQHPPDFLDGTAVAALIDHAAGSQHRLRAALASTLFLASTEDAPHVGRALVERALQNSDRRPTLRARHAPSSAWPMAGAAVTGIAVALAMFLLANRPTTYGTLRAHTVAPAPRSAAAVPLSTLQFVPPPAPFRPASQPTRAPAPARSAPPAPLVEQRVATPAVPPDTLPASPQATAVLIYSVRDPAALSRLDTLVRRLRQSGIVQIETRPPSTIGVARRPISYFYADDYEPAQIISTVLLGEGWPRLAGNSLAPRLVLTPTGDSQRHPGLIEVRLP